MLIKYEFTGKGLRKIVQDIQSVRRIKSEGKRVPTNENNVKKYFEKLLNKKYPKEGVSWNVSLIELLRDEEVQGAMRATKRKKQQDQMKQKCEKRQRMQAQGG